MKQVGVFLFDEEESLVCGVDGHMTMMTVVISVHGFDVHSGCMKKTKQSFFVCLFLSTVIVVQSHEETNRISTCTG